MDLRKAILKEHSRTQANKIIQYVGSDATRFKELVNIFLEGPYRVTQRAAWPMSHCVEQHPELIKPHIRSILKQTKRNDIHDAVKRNTVRMLQFIDIPKAFHAQVADLCFQFLSNSKEPVAIRVFSMTVIANLCKYHPELKQELKILIEDNLPFTSPAFRSRGMKVLKEINSSKHTG